MMLEHLNILIDYVLDAHAQAHDILDHPLYLAFVNGAAQTLGEIVLNDITTENTFGMEEYVQFTEIDNIYYTREIKDHLTMSDFLGLEEVNPGEGMPVLENIETIGYFTELFRADYEGMTEGDINTMMEAYLYGGEFVHESHHPFGNFISGILDVTIVKPLIECIIGKDLITGDKLTEFEQGMQFVDVLLGVLTLGQGTAAMKSADLTGKDAAKQLLKVWAVDAVSDTAAYTAGYVCDELGMPPGVTFIASLLTGCTVSLEVGKYVFRDGGKIVKQLDADEMLEYVGGGGKGGTDASDIRNINGQRTSRYRQLTDDEISQLLDDIDALEADSSIFRFNEGNQTGFLDSEGIINVRGDVLPDLNSNHPRDLMSPRAVLAHEYYGHKHFDDVFGVRNPLPGLWNDEFRASYNAALNAPNLSDMDRMYLMLDALERAKEAGVNITITDEIRRILYGY